MIRKCASHLITQRTPLTNAIFPPLIPDSPPQHLHIGLKPRQARFIVVYFDFAFSNDRVDGSFDGCLDSGFVGGEG